MKSGSAASWWGHRTPTQLGGTYSKPKKAGPVCASAAGLRPGLFCWLCAARRARVVAGGLRRQARNPQGPGSQAHVVGGWSVVVGGLPPASLCACPAAARPGPVPLLGVRSLVLPGFVCPPGPGLWRSLPGGSAGGVSSVVHALAFLAACLVVGAFGLCLRSAFRARCPARLLCSVRPGSPAGRLLGRWAQGRRPGRVSRCVDRQTMRPCQASTLCSPRRTRPKEAGQDPGGSRERMPPGLPSGPVGLALPGRLTVQKK